jgi:hypothetical protein
MLNYAAVLDTAADVARAMLHLHKQQARGPGPASSIACAVFALPSPFLASGRGGASAYACLEAWKTHPSAMRPQQIIHSDLKARNVLLKASKSGRGAVAKVRRGEGRGQGAAALLTHRERQERERQKPISGSNRRRGGGGRSNDLSRAVAFALPARASDDAAFRSHAPI